MSGQNTKEFSIPALMLLECVTHKVRVEMQNEDSYEGILDSCQENMNCQLVNVVKRAKNGQVTRQASAFIRGTNIAFVKMPNLIRSNPIFKPVPLGLSATEAKGY
jgi:small nuclear ribonucleoprotein D3